jgi:pyruvate-formate lyase-activating enzyme
MPAWYCPLPFKHAFVDSTGIAACCNTQRYPVTLDSWATDTRLLALQEKFNKGEIPVECNACLKQEQSQGRSLRTDANRDYHNQIFTETSIDFVDYRSSNICNFKCRSCEPAYSHGIDQEAKNNPNLAKFYRNTNSTKTVSITDANHTWVVDNITKIKRLMITGGEPTVIPGIKDMIATAVQRNPDINILITTNGSFTDQFWYDVTKRMPNLHWTLSLDAVGSAAETIRHGTNWAVVEHNARWLAEHSHSFDINTVVSNLNLLQLRPLLDFVNELQTLSTINGCVHQFHIVQRPYMLAADNIPTGLKASVLVHLDSCLELTLDTQQRNMITGLIEQITTSISDEQLLKKSTEFNNLLDFMRNETHSSLYQ